MKSEKGRKLAYFLAQQQRQLSALAETAESRHGFQKKKCPLKIPIFSRILSASQQQGGDRERREKLNFWKVLVSSFARLPCEQACFPRQGSLLEYWMCAGGRCLSFACACFAESIAAECQRLCLQTQLSLSPPSRTDVRSLSQSFSYQLTRSLARCSDTPLPGGAHHLATAASSSTTHTHTGSSGPLHRDTRSFQDAGPGICRHVGRLARTCASTAAVDCGSQTSKKLILRAHVGAKGQHQQRFCTLVAATFRQARTLPNLQARAGILSVTSRRRLRLLRRRGLLHPSRGVRSKVSSSPMPQHRAHTTTINISCSNKNNSSTNSSRIRKWHTSGLCCPSGRCICTIQHPESAAMSHSYSETGSLRHIQALRGNAGTVHQPARICHRNQRRAWSTHRRNRIRTVLCPCTRQHTLRPARQPSLVLLTLQLNRPWATSTSMEFPHRIFKYVLLTRCCRCQRSLRRSLSSSISNGHHRHRSNLPTSRRALALLSYHRVAAVTASLGSQSVRYCCQLA